VRLQKVKLCQYLCLVISQGNILIAAVAAQFIVTVDQLFLGRFFAGLVLVVAELFCFATDFEFFNSGPLFFFFVSSASAS